jgi:restriction system protein
MVPNFQHFMLPLLQAIGGTSDGGVDGVIKQDKLGLESILVQAKRWENQVGASTVRDFAGSLEGHRADKGVLITTSRFTPDAVDYVSRIGKRIVLIDGGHLAQLMIDHDVGVVETARFVLKKLDSDYFEGL